MPLTIDVFWAETGYIYHAVRNESLKTFQVFSTEKLLHMYASGELCY